MAMKLVMRNGEIREVDTKFMFGNQYNTTDGERVFDKDIKYIIDDVRLGEFYCSSVKQGTYEEVAQAIAEKRSQINKCEGCWWFHEHNRVKDKCHRDREEVIDGNKKSVFINEKIVYEISCAYIPKYGNKCVNDIDETPKLFREVNDCFFCKYPQGIPDTKPLIAFMIANAEKYGIVPRWGDQHLLMPNAFKHDRLFGSYLFEASRYDNSFELSNARNRFRFYVDFINKKFILVDGCGYKVRRYLGETKYDRIQNKSIDQPIANYDKFATWFWQIVDDFNQAK
jgi:hypothetical protein